MNIMRAFVKLRQMLSSNKKLAKRLDELEEKYDAQFKVVFDVIRKLVTLLNRNDAALGLSGERKMDKKDFL